MANCIAGPARRLPAPTGARAGLASSPTGGLAFQPRASSCEMADAFIDRYRR